MERINNSLINANIKLVDENKELKQEIERLNNIINEIEKYINQNEDLYRENERLNNIINELEKELNKDFNTYMIRNRQYGKVYKAGADNYRMHIYLKLQKLKESDKE